VVVFFYLTDGPAQATWLEPNERAWLAERLAAERRQREAKAHYSLFQALSNSRVLMLGVAYFGIVAANYGVSFWLPQIVKAFGLTNAQTGFVTAIPYLVGAFAMVFWGLRSDHSGERKWHTALPALLAAAGIALSTVTPNPTLVMIAMSVAAMGIFAALPCFWTLPTAFLSGTAAAGGIALINSIGNLAGFAGPYAVGYIKDATGGFAAGLLLIALLVFLSFVVIVLLGHDRALERHPTPEVAE
jgi:MFS transporter, ACS family, tartrate transporter